MIVIQEVPARTYDAYLTSDSSIYMVSLGRFINQ